MTTDLLTQDELNWKLHSLVASAIKASHNRSEISQPSISDDTRVLLAKETETPAQVLWVLIKLAKEWVTKKLKAYEGKEHTIYAVYSCNIDNIFCIRRILILCQCIFSMYVTHHWQFEKTAIQHCLLKTVHYCWHKIYNCMADCCTSSKTETAYSTWNRVSSCWNHDKCGGGWNGSCLSTSV